MKTNEDGCRILRAVMCIRTQQKRESQNIERVVGRKEGENQNPFRERRESKNKNKHIHKTRTTSVFLLVV